jgi:hypothetical protein
MNAVRTIRTEGFSNLTYRIKAKAPNHTVEFWYDRRSRNWIVQYLQEDGYQVGDADVVYTRKEAELAASEMATEVRGDVAPAPAHPDNGFIVEVRS